MRTEHCGHALATALSAMDPIGVGPALDDNDEESPKGLREKLFMKWLNAAHKSTIMVHHIDY